MKYLMPNMQRRFGSNLPKNDFVVSGLPAQVRNRNTVRNRQCPQRHRQYRRGAKVKIA
jgi:hypothetical protein